MKNERKAKTPLIAAQSAKNHVQKSAQPVEKDNGRKRRVLRVPKGAQDLADMASLQDQNPDPVMRFTRDGQPLFGNLAATSLLSFEVRQAVPQDWCDMVRTTFASGAKQEMEIEHGGKSFSALFVPIEELGYVNVYCRDVTERKKMQDALLESEQRLRLATQAAHICTWELNIQDQTYKLGDNFAEVLGFSPDLLPKNSQQVSDLLNVPEDMIAVREAVVHAVQTRTEVPPLQYRVINPETQERIWLEVNAQLVYDTEGKPYRMFGMVQNITGHKQREEKLLTQEAELQSQLDDMKALMEILPTGVWVGNADCSVITGNPAAYEMMGLTPGINASVTSADPQTPYGLRIFVNGQEVSAEDAPMQVVARSGKPVYNIEHELLFANGLHKSVYASIVPLFSSDGSVRKVIGAYTDITERKRMEDALRSSEERMRLAIESNRIVAWEWDPVTDQVTTSSNFNEVYGLTALSGSAEGFSLILPEDLPAHMEKVERVIHEGGEYRSEFRITRPLDGKIVWMEERARAITNAEGQVSLLVGIVTDASERKKVEGALKKAHEAAESTANRMTRLQEITASLASSGTPAELSELILEQGTRASGASAGILAEVVNQGKDVKTLAALGYPEAAVRRQPVPLAAPTPMSDCIRNRHAIWITSNQEFAAQYPALAEFRRGLGNESTVALPLIVGDRVLGGLAFSFVEKRQFLLEERGFLLAVAQQCAQGLERVRAAEALRESEERFARFMQHLPGLAWIKDIHGRYVFANDAAEKAFRVPRKRLYGRTDTEVFPPHVADRFRQNDEQALLEGRGVQVIEELEHEDGLVHYSLVNKFPILGSDGSATLIGGMAIDITERKQAEERLALLAEVSELAREIEEPDELMSAVAVAVGEHLHVKRCLFNEIDVENDLEIVHRDYYRDVPSVEGVHKISDYSNITSAEMMAGKTVVNNDSKVDPRTAQDYERSYVPNGERAYVAVPLMRDERWVASLWASDDTPRQWSSEEVSLLEAIAERTWASTEKLRINAALRNSEERLRVTFNTTAVGFATLRPDTHFLEVNDAFCRIAGYRREELLEMSSEQLTHPDYREHTSSHIAQLLAGEIPSFVLEKIYLRKDSSQIWAQNSVSLVRDAEGAPLHLIVICQDITARKHAEEELRRLNLQLEERVERRNLQLKTAGQLRRIEMVERRQAEDRFAKSFNASPAAMTITRFEDGRYRNANPKFIELLGYGLSEVIGHTSLELKIYKSLDERMNILKSIRKNKGTWGYETQLHTKTGRPLDVVISVVEIELEGEPHILSMITDVTERNQILAALRASEQQLRTLFDVLPVGVAYVRPNGEVIQVNRTLEQIIDVTQEELKQGLYKSRQYIRSNGTPMPPSEFASARALAEQRTIKNVETGIIKDGGMVIWTSVSATPISMPEPGVVVITVDVTERKHMDDELRRSHKRYQILSQRLVEIQEEERRTISRELHDRVGQSLAALNLNLSFLNSWIPANADAQLKTRLNDAIQLTEETISTIRDVMADLRPPALDDYGLEAALNAYADTFSRRFGIRILLVKPSIVTPRIHPSIELTLLRIVQEALTNVARHANASTATIKLSIEGKMVYLTIEDNGDGIRSWQKANRPGSHGLKIMRERAETFGGSLQVHSFNQKGTRIEVKIPMGSGDPFKARTETD